MHQTSRSCDDDGDVDDEMRQTQMSCGFNMRQFATQINSKNYEEDLEADDVNSMTHHKLSFDHQNTGLKSMIKSSMDCIVRANPVLSNSQSVAKDRQMGRIAFAADDCDS